MDGSTVAEMLFRITTGESVRFAIAIRKVTEAVNSQQDKPISLNQTIPQKGRETSKGSNPIETPAQSSISSRNVIGESTKPRNIPSQGAYSPNAIHGGVR